MADRPLVSIIVATINTPQLTEACLNSVIENTTVPHELIVVNNSRAKGIRGCLRSFGSRIRIVQNPRNLGYTKAANQGALVSRGEYLCFLNSDTLVPPRWLERLLEAVRRPRVGAVGPVWPNKLDADQISRTPSLAQGLTTLIDQALQKRSEPKVKRVKLLAGFCWLIPKVVLAVTGLFDERFYFGWEDADYCLRLRLHGFNLLRVDSLFVHHQWGGSSISNQSHKLRQESRVRFLKKWGTDLSIKDADRLYIFEAVDKKIKRGESERLPLPRLSVSPSLKKQPRLIRSGFALRSSANGKTALTRLSDLEVFLPDRREEKIWRLLAGSPPLRQVSNGGPFLIEGLKRSGLVSLIRPAKVRNIRVTVMMAAHNAERWIGEAIDSVLSQKFTNFELMIVDDGSRDRTAKIIRSYLWNPKVRFLKNPRQLGIAKTRNKILDLSRGEYVSVCDADDVMLPTLLEKFVGFLDSHKEVGWVYSDRLKIGPLGSCLGLDPAIPIDGKTEFKRNIIAHAGALIRKSAILRVGGYDETFLSTEDYDLALKIANFTQVEALSGEIHYLWRRHTHSTSLTNPWARHETRLILKRANPHHRKITRFQDL